LASCAKVGDPLPPLVRHPETVNDLKVVQVGDRVQIVFSLPPEEIEGVEVYRQCGASPSLTEEDEATAHLQRNQLLPYHEENRFVFEDSPGSNQTCIYGLQFANRQNRRSPFSNFVQTTPLPSARPPTTLRYQVHQDQIVVNWDPPTENVDGSQPPQIVGYLVNSKHRVSTAEYSDLEFRFGEVQSYRVQTISQDADPLILSPFSHTLRVNPSDEFPPATPQNVSAFVLEGEVQVFWDENKEADLEGYFLYSATNENRLKRSSSSITINRYVDESVVPGQTYYYQISAVDQVGNEGSKSEPVSVIVR
ncbi:hypothetical protein KAJ77_00620, partial [bacterium]|nr:hypothetical protein [bacterium]